MKTIVLSAVSILLVGIFFCPMAMAAPSMPADVQMVQPDPSLPKELSAFFGKWEGRGSIDYFLIVEKIGEEKASLYFWDYGFETLTPNWGRYEAQVIKERGKYKLWFTGRYGPSELTFKGEVLNWSRSGSIPESVRLKRVP